MDMLGRLIDRIASLEAEVVRLQRRVNNTFREGRVEEIFPGEGMARVSAHGAMSKKVPWLQRAGDIRDWDPPTVGERVLLISPTGEPGKGLILPGGYSSQFQQPHDKAGEAKRVVGDVSDLWTQDTRVIEAPRIILRGKVTIEGPCVTHNGTDIGDSHKHQGVMPGSALTGLSIPKDC